MLPLIIGDDRHRLHDPPYEVDHGVRIEPVLERPARIDAIVTALRAAGYPITPPDPQDDAALARVHDPDLLAFLRDGHAAWRAAGGPEVMIPGTFRSPRWNEGGRASAAPLGAPGWWLTDTSTPIMATSFAAARSAVDAALTGAEALLAGAARFAYALTRPPGHHAGPDHVGGFCLLNHAAIAARRLSDAGRVAVLDVDVHHGNGTQDVFWSDPQVLTVSLHGDPDHLYPYFSGRAEEVGAGPGRGANLNLPLPAGTDDTGFLAALDRAIERVATHDPVAVVVPLGWDTAAVDPIGSFALTTAAYPAIGRRLAALERPLLLVQEGGYAIDHLGGFAVGLLSGLTDDR